MKYNPFSLAILTFFIALGLMFSYASFANAYEQVVFSQYYDDFPDFEEECGVNGKCFWVTADATDNWPYITGWDYVGFIYSSSSVKTIDNISFGATLFNYTDNGIEEKAQGRWEVYRTNSTTTTGTLIAYTDYDYIYEKAKFDLPSGGYVLRIKTNTWYFNQPFSIGGGYFYRFVLQPKQGDKFDLYSEYSGGKTIPPPPIHTSVCFNEHPIEDCDGNDANQWHPSSWTSGWGKPAVKLSYGGTPTTEEYVTTQAPCQTNSNNQPTNSCNAPVPLTEVTVSGFANFETQNKKVSIYIKDKFLNNLDSVALYYTNAGYYDFEHTFYNLQASTTYNIQTCISDASAFPDFATNPTCTTIIYTNGDNPISYEQYWCEMFPTDPQCINATSTPTLWTNLGCEDIGITDVKLGVQCALVWAFEPSQNSIAQFQRAKDAILYSVPLGYVTYMVKDVTTAFTSTDTSIFEREIELGKYFGKPNTATTTISLEGLTQYTDMIDPVWDLIETILWLAFAVWFIYWGLTRQL